MRLQVEVKEARKAGSSPTSGETSNKHTDAIELITDEHRTFASTSAKPLPFNDFGGAARDVTLRHATGCLLAQRHPCKLLTKRELAPRAGLEPATLRLTEASRFRYRRRLTAMMITRMNDLPSIDCSPSHSLNLDRSRHQ